MVQVRTKCCDALNRQIRNLVVGSAQLIETPRDGGGLSYRFWWVMLVGRLRRMTFL